MTKKIKSLAVKYGAKIAGITTAISAASLALFAHATDPTLDDVLTNGVGTIVSTYTAKLVIIVPLVLAGVVAITLTFVGIKMALRWFKRAVL
jgi:hypothetical protein